MAGRSMKFFGHFQAWVVVLCFAVAMIALGARDYAPGSPGRAMMLGFALVLFSISMVLREMNKWRKL
jgi:hypothetical protein